MTDYERSEWHNMNEREKYEQLLCTDRLRETTVKRDDKIDEFYSDRSRIIYSSSFRRLQQKAQVFSLESNSSIRTRLTHSMEVSDLGRTIANRIACKLAAKHFIDDKDIPSIVAIVENACLLHDIGNPPFGHFGETAIRDWAKSRGVKALPDGINKKDKLLNELMCDFYEFDGNPQGFRTVTKLHTDYDKYSLNLTSATMLCILKYSRAAGEKKGEGILKKAGYFQSEKKQVEEISKKAGSELHHRYPFTYIMEAADDVAYCMSDIADGIEKQVLTKEIFIEKFLEEWKEKYYEYELCKFMPKNENISYKKDISIAWSKKAMDEIVDNYFKNHEDVLYGNADSLVNEQGLMGRVLSVMKSVSRKILYTSFEAENIELTGYAVITGILRKYEKLLKLPAKKFEKISEGEIVDKTEIERRLFNRLGKRYVTAYKYAVGELDKQDNSYEVKEWWLRVHLLLDHVSGMTDDFALETYQMLEGINLMHK